MRHTTKSSSAISMVISSVSAALDILLDTRHGHAPAKRHPGRASKTAKARPTQTMTSVRWVYRSTRSAKRAFPVRGRAFYHSSALLPLLAFKVTLLLLGAFLL
jgi:hypothetical protein